VEQADPRGAVRVVLDRRELCRHAELVALEVDPAVVGLSPPPRWRTVRRPWLFRPEPRFIGSRSGLCGWSVVISSKVERVMNRRPGEVAL
jgi:hypothetical protein